MKYFWIVLVFSFIQLSAAQDKPADTSFVVSSKNYAAIVAGRTISLTDFNAAMQVAKATLLREGDIDFESEEGQFLLATTKRSILDDLIDRVLLEQQAKDMKIQVTEAEIEQEIKVIKKSFPSQQAYEETLADEKINEVELRQGVHDRVVLAKMKQQIADNVAVSDREVEQFMHMNAALASRTKDRQYVYGVYETKALAEQAAVRFRKMPESAAAISTNYVDLGLVRPEVVKNLLQLKQGQPSAVYETAEGFVVYVCVKVLEESVEEATASRIEAKKFLINKKQTEQFDKWFAKLKKKTKIEINPDVLDSGAEGSFEMQKELPHGNLSRGV